MIKYLLSILFHYLGLNGDSFLSLFILSLSASITFDNRLYYTTQTIYYDKYNLPSPSYTLQKTVIPSKTVRITIHSYKLHTRLLQKLQNPARILVTVYQNRLCYQPYCSDTADYAPDTLKAHHRKHVSKKPWHASFPI